MLREHDSRPRTLLRVAGLAVLLLAGYLVFRPHPWRSSPAKKRPDRAPSNPSQPAQHQRPPTLHPLRRQNS